MNNFYKEELTIKKIAFLGGASWKPSDKPFIDAYQTAKLVAENGFTVVNGGGPGVLRAATMGAHDGGGYVEAVTYHPHTYHKNYEGVDIENKFDTEVYTLDYFDRTKVMLQNTELHIIFNGSTGTLSELGMTWASSRIHEEHKRPILLFGKHWEKVVEVLKKELLMRPGEINLVKIVTKPQEVLDFINEHKHIHK
jgi:uncharacterized protein (TIGR00725 family)